jgi:hypothetical protein
MFPSAVAAEPSFKITPIPTPLEVKTNYGVTIDGLDLNNVTGKANLLVDACKSHLDRFGCQSTRQCNLDSQSNNPIAPIRDDY